MNDERKAKRKGCVRAGRHCENDRSAGSGLELFLSAVRRKAVWLLIAAAFVFIVLGIRRGEMAEVFLKSTNICLECIGIG